MSGTDPYEGTEFEGVDFAVDVVAIPTEKMSYEVWERNLATGEISAHRTGLIYSVAVHWAKGFNKEVAYVDRYEDAPTREFFVVKATTTYEEV